MFISFQVIFDLESVLAQCLDLACLVLAYSMCLQNFAYFLLSLKDLLVKCFLFLLTHWSHFCWEDFYVNKHVDKIGVAILEQVYCLFQWDSADFSMQSLHTMTRLSMRILPCNTMAFWHTLGDSRFCRSGIAKPAIWIQPTIVTQYFIGRGKLL